MTSVADQGAPPRYTYTDDNRLAIQRGPQGETAFVNRYYTVRNGTVANKEIWSGDQRIVTKQQMPDGQLEQKEFWLHTDLQGSTNLSPCPPARSMNTWNISRRVRPGSKNIRISSMYPSSTSADITMISAPCITLARVGTSRASSFSTAPNPRL